MQNDRERCGEWSVIVNLTLNAVCHQESKCKSLIKGKYGQAEGSDYGKFLETVESGRSS